MSFGKRVSRHRRLKSKVDYEQALLDHARRQMEVRRKETAVIVYLSRASGYTYDNYVYAINMFRGLVDRFQGQLFILNNRDLVFCYEGPAGEPAVRSAVFNIRLLFDVPSSAQDVDGDGSFATWIDVGQEPHRLLEYAQERMEEKIRRHGAASVYTAVDGTREDTVDSLVTPSLALIDRFLLLLERTELRSLFHWQSVCQLGAEADRPRPVFQEVSISMPELERTLMPGAGLTADRYLFQFVTRALDKRVMALLAERPADMPTSDFSINMNVETFFSREFKAFDESLDDDTRKTIVLEFPRVEVLSDIAAFLAARDGARKRGYKLAIDGLTPVVMPFIRLQDMELDFIKFRWRPDMVGSEEEMARSEISGVMERCRDSRIVLYHCESEAALEYGRQLGIELYQGYYVDDLLKNSALPQGTVQLG